MLTLDVFTATFVECDERDLLALSLSCKSNFEMRFSRYFLKTQCEILLKCKLPEVLETDWKKIRSEILSKRWVGDGWEALEDHEQLLLSYVKTAEQLDMKIKGVWIFKMAVTKGYFSLLDNVSRSPDLNITDVTEKLFRWPYILFDDVVKRNAFDMITWLLCDCPNKDLKDKIRENVFDKNAITYMTMALKRSDDTLYNFFTSLHTYKPFALAISATTADRKDIYSEATAGFTNKELIQLWRLCMNPEKYVDTSIIPDIGKEIERNFGNDCFLKTVIKDPRVTLEMIRDYFLSCCADIYASNQSETKYKYRRSALILREHEYFKSVTYDLRETEKYIRQFRACGSQCSVLAGALAERSR